MNGNESLSKPKFTEMKRQRAIINTLWTGDADLRLYITTVQDG